MSDSEINKKLLHLQDQIVSAVAALERIGIILENQNKRLAAIEKTTHRAAVVASCLANGIQPD